MELKFYGAAKEVTGSCFMLQVGKKRLLIDCGMQQGAEEKEDPSLPFDVNSIDAVLITHAHIDHTGRLPLLVKNGYRKRVIATEKTCELMRIMLLDSAHIQESEAKWKSRKSARAAQPAEQPLYTTADAANVFELLRPVSYGEEIEVCEGVKARFTDAGHLLGSASITLDVTENGLMKRIVFSGDIGNFDQPIIRDPQYLHDADYAVMESTYGNRIHRRPDDLVAGLAEIFDQTFARGGNVVIPSFAVGRAQELLFDIREIKERYLVKSMPNFPVYLDSPLADEATAIYDGDLDGYADEETVEILQNGFEPLSFPHLHLCKTVEESVALNLNSTPKVIISASGMCDAGRIRHHLKHNLWRPECSVVIVGYQAEGTLGRILLERPAQVKLFGEQIAVRAQIHNFKGMSAHADRDGLLKWAEAFSDKPQIFVVHGEEKAAESLTQELAVRGFDASAPDYEAVVDLQTGSYLSQGVPAARLRKHAAKPKQPSSAYARLELMGKRLQDVIRHNEGGTNKDLSRFADQLRALMEKWDR